jgi:hypothetical protein
MRNGGRVARQGVGIAAIVVVLVAMSGSVAPAEGCSCAGVGPPCQAFWSAEAVFDATVLKIEKNEQRAFVSTDGGPPVPALFNDLVVTLEVHRPWKGPAGDRIQVLTNDNSGSCGYPFEPGVRYLVFAHRSRADGRWEVSLCGATVRYDGTGDTAAFLASLEKPPPGGRLLGTVRLVQTRLDGSSGPHPLMDVPVRLIGAGGMRTTTARGGRYEFTGLPPGHYDIEPVPPQRYRALPSRAEIVNGHACAQADLRIRPAVGITGRAVGASGAGIPGLEIRVAGERFLEQPGSVPTVSARTDELGDFAFDGLAPGRYILGVNLGGIPNRLHAFPSIIYPGALDPPHVFELSLGEARDIGHWELPSSPAEIPIMGWVTWANGTPAARVRVHVSDVTDNGPPRLLDAATTGPDGGFSVNGREGRTYAFVVRPDGPGLVYPVRTFTVVATPGMPPVRLTIQRPPPEG